VNRKASKKLERTDWISCKEKPVRVGWYECYYDNTKHNLPDFIRKRYWDGWEWCSDEPWGICFFGKVKTDKWRGLTKEAR